MRQGGNRPLHLPNIEFRSSSSSPSSESFSSRRGFLSRQARISSMPNKVKHARGMKGRSLSTHDWYMGVGLGRVVPPSSSHALGHLHRIGVLENNITPQLRAELLMDDIEYESSIHPVPWETVIWNGVRNGARADAVALLVLFAPMEKYERSIAFKQFLLSTTGGRAGGRAPVLLSRCQSRLCKDS